MNPGWEGMILSPHLLLRRRHHHRPHPGATLKTDPEEIVDPLADPEVEQGVVREEVRREVPVGQDPVAGEVQGANQDPDPEAGAENPIPGSVPEVDLPVEMGQETQAPTEKVIMVEDHLPSPHHQNVDVVGGYSTVLPPEYRLMIFYHSSLHRGRYQRRDPPRRRLQQHRHLKVIKQKEDQVGDRL